MIVIMKTRYALPGAGWMVKHAWEINLQLQDAGAERGLDSRTIEILGFLAPILTKLWRQINVNGLKPSNYKKKTPANIDVARYLVP